jgi:hypothetical protein
MVPDNNTVTYDPSNQDSSLKFEDLGSVPDLTDDDEDTDNSGIIAAAVIVPLIIVGLIILVAYIVI